MKKRILTSRSTSPAQTFPDWESLASHPSNCILNAYLAVSTDRFTGAARAKIPAEKDGASALKYRGETRWMSPQRLFEMRTYHPAAGRMAALEGRFREHTMRLFAHHGIVSVGYWKTYGSHDVRLIYILAYPDLDSRERSWAQFRADPEWQAAAAASETDGPLVARRESIYLHATDYSPPERFAPSTLTARGR